MKNKKIKLKYAIIVWVIVFILSIGTTFALNVWTSGNTTIAGNTMCFDIKYTIGQDISFSDMTASLTFDESSSAFTIIRFARQNGCLLKGIGTITANIDVSTTANLSTGALKYKIINNNTSEEVVNGSITSTGSNIIYDNFDIIDSTIYNIYFWLDANYIDNTYLESSFSGSIEASAKSTNEYGEISDLPTLYDTIKLNASLDNTSSEFVTSSSGIDFGAISSDTNGKGVYLLSSTQNDSNPIYYYRGAVTDNNVIFADFCWKIVRTTETGGVKLIYNGVPTDGTCNNTGTASQLSSTKAFNSSYNSPAYVGYMYGTPYAYSSKSMSGVTDIYYYGNSVTYSDGTYTLTDTITSSSWSSIYNGGLNSNHYTCFSTGDSCSSVYYIYYTDDSTAYYITLTEGKTVEDALSEMLDNNTTSSTIKGDKDTEGTIDNWYYMNIDQKGYGSYVEDTVWCNDRSIYSKGGWDPNGGSTRSYFYFSARDRLYTNKTPSLTCTRDIDKFTVSTVNGNGALDYLVGLLTADEIMLAGGLNEANSSYYLYTGQYWWAGTPRNFYYDIAYGFRVVPAGILDYYYVDSTYGVRPAISLAFGTEVSSGSGTVTDPYVVS